jgi:hypothetical protein
MLAWGCFVENKEKAAHECLTFLAYKALSSQVTQFIGTGHILIIIFYYWDLIFPLIDTCN